MKLLPGFRFDAKAQLAGASYDTGSSNVATVTHASTAAPAPNVIRTCSETTWT